MEANKILSSDILDILFEGRNKDYGAYDLRRGYNKTLKKALIITSSAILIIILSFVIVNFIKSNANKTDFNVVDTQLAEIKQDEPPPPPPPPPKPPPPPELNQVKFTPPKIVKDEEVKPEEKIEDIKDEQVISTKTVESDNTNAIVAPVDDGSRVVEAPSDDENKIFSKVEIEAGFPGGEQAWVRYLRKNLDPNVPIDNAAPEGTYQVIIRFIVSKDGTISDVTPETRHGYGMEEEAVKIIKKGPKWTPALQNGRNVNAYRRQPITFVVTEQ